MRFVWLSLLTLAHGVASECPPATLSVQEARGRFHELDKRAQAEFRHEEFTNAAEDFRQGTCLAPESLRSYYKLFGTAAGALAAGNSVQARQTLEEADRVRPGYPLPLAMLVKVSLTSGDLDGLRAFLRAAAVRFPADGKLHAEFVKDLAHRNLLDLALAEALRFEQSGVADAEATITLAALENNAGAHGDAVRHALAIEAQSELPDGERASGATIAGLGYENLGRLPEAVTHLRLAIQLAPDREDSYLALARIHQKQQNPKAAAEVLEQGRKRFPNSPGLLLALGSSRLAAEQSAAAVQILSELIQNFPDRLEAYTKLAEAYRGAGHPDLATATLQKLAARKPDYPMLHTSIAESLLAENPVNYNRVLDELAQAEKAAPGDYDIFYLRGKVYASMTKYQQAEIAFRRAISLRPAEAGAHYQLGLVYRNLGQHALAKQEFEQVEHLKGESSAR